MLYGEGGYIKYTNDSVNSNNYRDFILGVESSVEWQVQTLIEIVMIFGSLCSFCVQNNS